MNLCMIFFFFQYIEHWTNTNCNAGDRDYETVKMLFFWSKLFEGLGTIHLRNAGNVGMFCNIPAKYCNIPTKYNKISRHSFEQLFGIICRPHQHRFNFIHFQHLAKMNLKYDGMLAFDHMWAWGGFDGIFSEDLTSLNNGCGWKMWKLTFGIVFQDVSRMP